jgi:lysozyme
MTLPIQELDPTQLDEAHAHALALLVHLTPQDLASVKHLLHLGAPQIVGPQTLEAFMTLCQSAGREVRDFSTAGVSAFKRAHGLDDTGANHGAIGQTTATAWVSLLLANIPVPTPGRHITATGRAIIENFEGLSLTAYRDQVGVWTIGYGHTQGVEPDQVVTQAQADAFLTRDVAWAEAAVTQGVGALMSDNQFNAFVSMTFNIGAAGFLGSSCCRFANAGLMTMAADAMLLWDKGTINGELVVIPGLLERRQEERALALRS